MSAAEQLDEIAVRHQVFLERLKSGEIKKFDSFLRRMDKDIRRRLGGVDLTAYSRARLERLLASIEKDLSAVTRDHQRQLFDDLDELAIYEAGFESRSLNVQLDNFETVIPAPVQLAAAVRSRPLSVRGAGGGKLLEPFVKEFSATEVKRLTGAIRQGFYEGQTTTEILQVVRGTRANQYRDGILATTSRNAEAIVRTAVQHVAATARQQTWNENRDLVKKVVWVSTLDGRTSQQCRSLDGMTFDVDKGPRPPIHIRCRSTTRAELDPEFAFLRQGATRASIGGQVEANQSYYDWLKKQPAAFQDAAIGPVRGQLFREGGLTAQRFAELNLGRNFEPLTLAEMRKLEPLAFERAFGGGAAPTIPAPTVQPPAVTGRRFAYETFKPLPSVAAAKQWAVDNVTGTIELTRTVSLEGLNQALRATQEVIERYDLPKLRYIGDPSKDIHRYRGFGSRTMAAFAPGTDAYLFRSKGVDPVKVVAAGERGKGRLKNPALKEQVSRLRKAAPYVKENIGEMQSFDWSVSNDVRSITFHEMGHRLHHLFNSDIDSILTRNDISRGGWNYLVGKYAGTNSSEYVAETFSLYMQGDQSQYWRIMPELLNFFKSKDLK
jgi:SPP1 gp7 family putative phage head morphogenesis protein